MRGYTCGDTFTALEKRGAEEDKKNHYKCKKCPWQSSNSRFI
jgi:hypothetical protein